ncbi:MAG: ferric reductase-like transmembrane domain-containing protein [Chloroflexi bacterium]|nr:ferric reductase-like transmembrane domain-containing protein [Chloroflexota bacterium]
MQKKRPFPTFQLLIHLLAWLPLLWLLWAYWQDQLGFNPVRTMTLRTGKTALILLLLSLTCTPLNLIFGWKWVYRLRRPSGVYAFFYAALHFLTFVGLDYGFDLALAADALRINRFALVGLASFLILLPLAVTSTRRAMLWMGEKRWRWLHRLSYLAAALAILHYALLVRQYYTQPIIFGAILALLLGVRLVVRRSASSKEQKFNI